MRFARLALAALLLPVLVLAAHAQDTTARRTLRDEVNLAPARAAKSKRQSIDRFVSSYDFNGFASLPAGAKTMGTGRGITSAAFAQQRFGHFAVAIGLGFSSNNFFTNISAYDPKLLGTPGALIPDSAKVKRAKLVLTTIDVPLELRFYSSAIHGSSRIKVAAGFKVGYGISIHEKYVYNTGEIVKYRLTNDLKNNIERFRYGITARLAYGKYGIMGYYGLNSLVKNGASTLLMPYSIGLSVTM